jgi:uncharacterized protein YraI
VIRSALLLALLAVTTAAHGQDVYEVDREQVNVRQDATTQSSRVAVLQRGEQVVEERRVGDWLAVRLPDGRPGWIHAQLLRPRLVVDGEGLRLRSGPSTGSTSVTLLYRGQEVARLGQRGDWTQVEIGDGRSGWLASRYVRPKRSGDLQAERPAGAAPAAPAAVATPVEPPADEPVADVAAVVQRDPYAEGLQHEAGGDHARALAAFLDVLEADPDQVNALVHAAQNHVSIGEPEEARLKLVRALQLTGGRKDVYLTLGQIYRQQGQADSAAKYQALFRGETPPVAPVRDSVAVDVPSPVPEGTELDDLPTRSRDAEEGGALFDSIWLPVGLAGLGLLALAGVGWWVLSTSSHRTARGEAVASDPRFEKVMGEESRQARQGRATSEEEAELDRQIEARWRDLKESRAAFAAPPASAEGVDGVLDQVEGLRRTLEGQDERSKIYADIVRLQNMKIDAMTEEIRRLRRG